MHELSGAFRLDSSCFAQTVADCEAFANTFFDFSRQAMDLFQLYRLERQEDDKTYDGKNGPKVVRIVIDMDVSLFSPLSNCASHGHFSGVPLPVLLMR